MTLLGSAGLRTATPTNVLTISGLELTPIAYIAQYTRVREESLFPIAGTTHLNNNLINSTSISRSWEGPSSFTATQSFRDRNISRRLLVDWLLMHGHLKHAGKEGLSSRTLCRSLIKCPISAADAFATGIFEC
jgi:hypothetical protein